jgi:hypothetical protein
VQQKLVDVEEPAPPPGLDAGDDFYKLGMLGFFDERDAGHLLHRGRGKSD